MNAPEHQSGLGQPHQEPITQTTDESNRANVGIAPVTQSRIADPKLSHASATGRSPQTLGTVGEQFVAAWLQQQGWTILHQQWRCRWGEIDVIAKSRGTTLRSPNFGSQAKVSSVHSIQSTQIPISLQPALQPNQPMLVFVEVKLRKQKNWDDDGLSAITSRKQAKLVKAAQMFLSTEEAIAELPCRFDVALVSHIDRPVSRALGKSRGDRSSPDIDGSELHVDTTRADKPKAEPVQTQLSFETSTMPIRLGQPTRWQGHYLTLVDYVSAAFEIQA